MYSRR